MVEEKEPKGPQSDRQEKEFRSILLMDQRELERLNSQLILLKELRQVALDHNESSDYRDYTDEINQLEKQRKRLEARISRS